MSSEALPLLKSGRPERGSNGWNGVLGVCVGSLLTLAVVAALSSPSAPSPAANAGAAATELGTEEKHSMIERDYEPLPPDTAGLVPPPTPAPPSSNKTTSFDINHMRQVSMGILRVDYSYDTNIGDMLDPRSHEFGIISTTVKGLTFPLVKNGVYDPNSDENLTLCKEAPGTAEWAYMGSNTSAPVVYAVDDPNCEPALAARTALPGDLPPEVKYSLKKSVFSLLENGADFITGDCGFMIYYQVLVRAFISEWTWTKGLTNMQPPVLMSSLLSIPTMLPFTPPGQQIVVLTAKESALMTMRNHLDRATEAYLGEERFLCEKFFKTNEQVGCPFIPEFMNFDNILQHGRVFIKGLDELSPTFDLAVNIDPKAVPDRRVINNELAVATRALAHENPSFSTFIVECTEAYTFADAIKMATGLPVWTGNDMAHHLSLGFRMEMHAIAITARQIPDVDYHVNDPDTYRQV